MFSSTGAKNASRVVPKSSASSSVQKPIKRRQKRTSSFMPRRTPTKEATTTTTTPPPPPRLLDTKKSRRAHLKTMLLSSTGGLLFVSIKKAPALALEANEQLENKSGNEFVQNLVDKSEAKRDERRRERLDAYSKKNFKEYLQFVEHGKTPKTENEKKIRAWLEANAE